MAGMNLVRKSTLRKPKLPSDLIARKEDGIVVNTTINSPNISQS
jgi:hypothetical protein